MRVMLVSPSCCPESVAPFLGAGIRRGSVDPSIVVIYADVDYVNISTGRQVVLLSGQHA